MSDDNTKKGKPARERILLAAVNEFAKKGFDGASTSGIARKAKVTQPLVHYHFETKENLWRETVGYSFNIVHDALGTEDDHAGLSPRERFVSMVRRYVWFNAQHPEFGRMILMEGSTAGPRLSWMINDFLRPLYHTLSDALKEGQQEGWAKPDMSVELVTFFLAGAASTTYQMPEAARELYGLDVHDEATIHRHADALVEVLISGLLID